MSRLLAFETMTAEQAIELIRLSKDFNSDFEPQTEAGKVIHASRVAVFTAASNRLVYLAASPTQRQAEFPQSECPTNNPGPMP